MADEDQTYSLLALRGSAKLSQDALAELAGISLKAYQLLEANKTRKPHSTTVQGLAAALAAALKIEITVVERALARQFQTAPNSAESLLSPRPQIPSFREDGAEYTGYPTEVLIEAGEAGAQALRAPAVQAKEHLLSPNGAKFPADLVEYYQDYCQCEEIFRKLARQNAHCDIGIFDDLYRELRDVNIATEWRTRKARLSAARNTIKVNLANVLDATRDLFKILHHQEFAVCIQFLQQIEQHGVNIRTVQTLMRDPVSAVGVDNSEGDDGEFHEIEANTISHEIYNMNAEFVHFDNLKEKIQSGVIKTTSRNAGVRYNAVLVKRLPRFGRSSVDSITSLCVDTPASAFNEERLSVSKHFVAEIGWRVSVMLYRLEIIEEELQILTQR